MAAWLRRAAPADGSGELARAPDEGESFFQRMMGKRKAEASPHVSPDKGAASERVDEAASYLESLAVGISSNACGDSSGSSSSEAKPEAHGMKGVKNRVGTDERWAEKIDKDQIFEEIKAAAVASWMELGRIGAKQLLPICQGRRLMLGQIQSKLKVAISLVFVA